MSRIEVTNETRIRVCKAGTADGSLSLPRTIIDIVDEVPDFGAGDHEMSMRMFYEDQARRIVVALQSSLPGGTLDRITRLLLEAQASLLRRTHRPV